MSTAESRRVDVSVVVNHDRIRTHRRPGWQFNTMVWSEIDPLTGASRDALLLAAEDPDALGTADGHPVTVTSREGHVSRA